MREKTHVVEDEVDTGELLPSLDEDTGEGTEPDLVVTRAETVEVATLAERLLGFKVGTDVVELDLEFGIGLGETSEARKGMSSIGVAAALDQPTRRLKRELTDERGRSIIKEYLIYLGEEEHSDGKDCSPDELNTDGDTV